MAQPLYFLPHLRPEQIASVSTRRSVLEERGLLDVFVDVPMDRFLGPIPLSKLGPGGLPGLVLGYQTPSGGIPDRVGFYPEFQTWTPVGDGQHVWIGIDKAEPPTANDLIRPKPYAGYVLQLADGKDWQIPVIRREDGSSELPKSLKWDATGTLVEPVKPAYAKYWNDTAVVARWLFDGERPIDKHLALKLAIQAVCLNYRYSVSEHSVIEAVDGENYMTVLGVTVDMPDFWRRLESQKKTSPSADSASTTPGLQDDCPAIDQAAATST